MLGAVSSGISTGNVILITEVGAVLLAVLGIAWKGGSMAGVLRAEQHEMQRMIAETKARVETMQSVELEKMRGQIQSLQTTIAVLQAAGAKDPRPIRSTG